MLTSSVMVDTEERGHTRVCLTRIYLLTWHFSALAIGRPNRRVEAMCVGYMHAPRSIQMNSCLLFFILCFYFTHSIILIHFYESLFFPIFFSILFSFIRAFICDAALHICFRFEATRVPRHFGRSRLLGGYLLPHATTRLLP